jgi:hypothetical protein
LPYNHHQQHFSTSRHFGSFKTDTNNNHTIQLQLKSTSLPSSLPKIIDIMGKSHHSVLAGRVHARLRYLAGGVAQRFPQNSKRRFTTSHSEEIRMVSAP